jgi:hypothetical protein
MKSAASSAWVCERRNGVQVVAARSGAGSMLASRRISQTVDAATFTPSVSSSPCTRRVAPRRVLLHEAQHQDVRCAGGPAAVAATPRRGGERPDHG